MKDDSVYLRHIRDAIQRIERYTAGGRVEFERNSMVQDAVVRNLEVIGEAVKNLSPDLRRRHRAVPWRSLTVLRNILIHEYFGVDLEIVWRVVQRRIPWLRRQVDILLSRKKP